MLYLLRLGFLLRMQPPIVKAVLELNARVFILVKGQVCLYVHERNSVV